MRFRTSAVVMIASVLVSLGCISTKPVHYYTIEPPAVPAAPGKPEGLVLLIGNIETPEALQDGRIRYRTGSHEAGGYDLHRWTERPGIMVRDSLVRALKASGQYHRVVESASSTVGDYLLLGKLTEFDEVDAASIHTKISLQVELVDKKSNLDVWDYLAEHEEPVNGKRVGDVVESLDRNLQRVVAETTTEIGKFLAIGHR